MNDFKNGILLSVTIIQKYIMFMKLSHYTCDAPTAIVLQNIIDELEVLIKEPVHDIP